MNFVKLTQLLLPTALRQPTLSALLRVMVAPIEQLYEDWTSVRDAQIFKLSHNSQVCYMRAMLNKSFGCSDSTGYFAISTIEKKGDWVLAYDETDALINNNTPAKDNAYVALYSEDEIAIKSGSFIVYVPEFVWNDEIELLPRCKSLVNEYRLTTTIPQYTLLTN